MMNYLIILILCLLATSKMSFQSAFSKKNVKTTLDSITFIGFVFIFSALLFIKEVFGCSPVIWLYALVGAVFTVLFQLLYTKALSIGNVSLTVLIVNFGMVITVLVSYIFYKEPISLLRLIGILLTIASFVVCNKITPGQKPKKNWLLYTVLAMLASSMGTIVQKVLGESPYSGESKAFVSCLYIIAAVATFIIYIIMSKKGEKRTFSIGFNVIKYAFAVGLSLAVYQGFYTYSLSTIDGTFLFPTYTGGTVVFSTLSGVVIFKDKLNKQQILGIILGVLSIVLMNF